MGLGCTDVIGIIFLGVRCCVCGVRGGWVGGWVGGGGAFGEITPSKRERETLTLFY